MIELATNTSTAESRIGNHKPMSETIKPPGRFFVFVQSRSADARTATMDPDHRPRPRDQSLRTSAVRA
jgi:hypothetical protein